MRDIIEKYGNYGMDPLVAAAFLGDMESIQATDKEVLREHLSARDEFNRTPVMVAAWYNHRDVATLLYEMNMADDAVDEDGRNIAWYFTRMGDGRRFENNRLSARGQVIHNSILKASENADEVTRSRGRHRQSKDSI